MIWASKELIHLDIAFLPYYKLKIRIFGDNHSFLFPFSTNFNKQMCLIHEPIQGNTVVLCRDKSPRDEAPTLDFCHPEQSWSSNDWYSPKATSVKFIIHIAWHDFSQIIHFGALKWHKLFQVADATFCKIFYFKWKASVFVVDRWEWSEIY